jgi:hypothetical protein
MSVVAIDIDETLYSFDEEIRETFFELAIERGEKVLLKGAYSLNQEWRNLTDVLGTEIALEAIDRVHSRQQEMTPFKGAVETVCELAENHRIKYVTSRLSRYWDSTDYWLSKNGFPEGDLVCSTHDKREHLLECQYLVDDRPMTIINFLFDKEWDGPQRKAFGLWRAYNHNLTDIKNVYLAPNWVGLAYYLKRKEVI